MPKPGTRIDATHAADALEAAQAQFIESWSTMSGAWGISRTMAQVHALLYVTGEPKCTDDVMERLGISRGNASMSLRALLEWGVIARVEVAGDRKDYFQAEQDVWAMFRAIARQRIKREVSPLLESLAEIRELTPEVGAKGQDELRDLNRRLDEMREFFEILSEISQRFAGPSGAGLKVAAKLLAKTPLPRKKAPDQGDTP